MVTALNLIIIKYIVVERKYMRLKCLKNIYVGVILLVVVMMAAGCRKSSGSSEEVVQCRMPMNLTVSMQR